MNLRERWESRTPLARAAFFGVRGPEEDAVFDWGITGITDAVTMAVDRRGHLARVLVPMTHLIYLVDLNPRQTSAPPADVRVFMDGGFTFDAVIDTIRHMPSRAWGMLVYHNEDRVRALVSEYAIQEVVPLSDDGEDVKLLALRDEYSYELWPEFGHKR